MSALSCLRTCLLSGVMAFCLIYHLPATAQCLCLADPDEPTLECADAPQVCLQQACYTTGIYPSFGWFGFCGPNTSIHNPLYFTMIPSCPNVVIHIEVGECNSMGVGLQSALIDACPWDLNNVLACNPGTSSGGTMILEAFGLTVGQPYWLVVDGSNGARCEFMFTHVSCIEQPGLADTLETLSIDQDTVCPGYSPVILEAAPAISNAWKYEWAMSWFGGDTLYSTDPEFHLQVSTYVPDGTYSVCVRALSGCDASPEPVCGSITVVGVPRAERPTESYCTGDFPFMWHDVEITGAGTYVTKFTSPEGCPFDSIWRVTIMEPPTTHLSVTEDTCLGNGYMTMTLIYEADTAFQESVLIYLNGELVDTFAHQPDGITLDSVPAPLTAQTTFTICAVTAPGCCASLTVETPDCGQGLPCRIALLSAESDTCITDSTLAVSVDFYPQGLMGDSVDLYDGEILIGRFDPADFPLTLTDFPGRMDTTYTVIVCSIVDTACCDTVPFSGPPCFTPPCVMGPASFTVTECTEADSFFFILDLQVENAGPNGFSIASPDSQVGIFLYEDLPIQLGPFPADSTLYAFHFADVTNPDCQTSIAPGQITCEVATVEMPHTDIFEIRGNGSLPVIAARQTIRLQLFYQDGRRAGPSRRLLPGDTYALSAYPAGLYIGHVTHGKYAWPVKLVRMQMQ